MFLLYVMLVMLEERRIYPINRYVKFIKRYYTFGI